MNLLNIHDGVIGWCYTMLVHLAWQFHSGCFASYVEKKEAAITAVKSVKA